MDLAIFLILMAVVIFFFKRFSSFIYFVAIVDIFLRILTFVKVQTKSSVPELYALINKYIPENIPSIIGRYTNGIVYTVLVWIYVIIFCIFLFYVTRTFFRKK